LKTSKQTGSEFCILLSFSYKDSSL